MKQTTLSITIIGHNEAHHLKELLPQLQWADELIYVDCESTDNSLQIAKQMGCKTFQRPNLSNLNVNKSFAIDQATSDWIFYLDPDERIPQALREEIQEVIHQPGKYVAFELNRRNFYFGHWLKYGSQYPDIQLRLFRRGKARFPNRHVHEKLKVDGPIGKLKQDMVHYPYQNVSQYLQKFNFYTSFEAEYLHQQKVTIGFVMGMQYLLIIPITRFVRRYVFKGGFLDGVPGFFAALFDALSYVVRYVKLWELVRQKNHV